MVLLCFAGVTFAILAHSRRKARLVSTPRQITISMDAQGRTEISGVSIGNTNLRDAALRLMDKLDVAPKIVIPKTMTNAQQASNFIQTLESLNRAGLMRQKQPNPYE